MGKGFSWLGRQLFGSGTDDFHASEFAQNAVSALHYHFGNTSSTFDHYLSAPTYGLPYLSILQGDPYGGFLTQAVPIAGQLALAMIPGVGEAEAPEEIASLLGGGCFVAGTPVQMADGSTMAIEQIKVGDLVLSRDQFAGPDGKIVGKRVEKAVVHRVSHTVLLTLSSGEQIETTEIHPFYVPGVGFVPAGQLCIGNLLLPRAGPQVMVTGVERKAGPTTVYNFSVEDFHTYCVGDTQSGIWVHNQQACFADAIKLTDHFTRHGADFGATSEAEYEQMASNFMTGPQDPATLMRIRGNGDRVFFNPNSNAFGVLSQQNVIRTYYVPTPGFGPGTHPYPTNLDYFNAQ